MGNSITDEQQLVVTIGDEQAGGKKGQLILDSVNFQVQRDNSQEHGIGNEKAQAIAYGNQEATVDVEEMLNEAAARLVDQTFGEEPLTGAVETPNRTFDLGELDWNDFSFEASDGDGAPTLSASFDVLGWDVVTPDEDLN